MSGRGRGDRPQRPEGRRPRDERPAGMPVVVLLEGRGRFLVGERFFERGPRVTIGQGPRDARAGQLALVVASGRGGRAKVLRVLGRPHIARDVLEALMLDRGLRRRFPAGVEAAAREARDAAGATQLGGGRRDLRDLPTFTIDPASAKDFDDAISAQDLGSGRVRVWVHIADVSAFVRPGAADRSRGLSPRDERLRARAGGADAAGGAVERGLLARAGPRPPRGDRRAGDRRGTDGQGELLPVADQLRRAPGL